MDAEQTEKLGGVHVPPVPSDSYAYDDVIFVP